MRSVRVIIADDHSLVRAGFCALVSRIDGIEVVAEAGDGHEALRLAKELHPDIILTDIAMPCMNGIELSGRISKEFPEVKVIVLSMHADAEYVIRALRAGAAGYMLKDAGTDELELALRSVIKGKTFLSPSVSKQVIDDYLFRVGSRNSNSDRGDDLPECLTSRQREVLQLIAEGLTTKEIAQRLDLSIKTVDTHRTQIMERLDIHDIAGLVRYAIRKGIIAPE